MTPEQKFVLEFDQRRKEYLERKGLITQTPEQQQAEVEYWNKVFSSEPKPRTFAPRVVRQEMEYDKARSIVRELFKDRAQEIAQIEDRPFKWDFSPELTANVQTLIKYFINDQTCPVSLSKGLFIYGPNGTTKTETMLIFERFCDQEKLTKAFRFDNLSKIHNDAKVSKDYDPITPNIQFNRCFDEFSRHTGPITRFGEQIDINEAILETRYDRFKRYGQTTHLICNAETHELKNVLSQMVFDRLRSMMTSIKFSGNSKR